MTSNNPLVSIGVASYNNSKFIVDTLDSIRTQIYPAIQLIIVDDGSKEDNVAVIKKWIQENNVECVFVSHAVNLGVTRTCNELFRHAKGKYFVLIGSDDLMLPERISRQIDFLERNPGTSVVFSDMFIINENNEITNDSYFGFINETEESYRTFLQLKQEEKIALLIEKNILPSPAIIYRSEVVRKLGGWDENLFFEDWDMMLRLVAGGYKFDLVEGKLIKYRVISNSSFRKPNPRFLDSILLTISKYRGISKEIDKQIDKKVVALATDIYRLGGISSTRWLFRKSRLTKDFSTILYCTFSSVGIKYRHLQLLRKIRK